VPSARSWGMPSGNAWAWALANWRRSVSSRFLAALMIFPPSAVKSCSSLPSVDFAAPSSVASIDPTDAMMAAIFSLMVLSASFIARSTDSGSDAARSRLSADSSRGCSDSNGTAYFSRKRAPAESSTVTLARGNISGIGTPKCAYTSWSCPR